MGVWRENKILFSILSRKTNNKKIYIQYVITIIIMSGRKNDLDFFFLATFASRLVCFCFFFAKIEKQASLTTETVQSAALAFQRVHNIHRSDGLAASVLGVSDGVTDDVFKKHFQHTTSLLVDQVADAFHTSSASQAANSRFGDTLDVIAQHFTVN